MEGLRQVTTGINPDAESLSEQKKVPLVGSSLSLSREYKELETGCGTLGGYVCVDGKKYGLTNHHVCFAAKRTRSYPDESETASPTKYWMKQPAQLDVDNKIKNLNDIIEYLRENFPEQKREEISRMEEELCQIQKWDPKASTIGHIYRTSGIRAREGEINSNFRMDWALIELETSIRVTQEDEIVNEVSPN
jgi:hypothetical protein